MVIDRIIELVALATHKPEAYSYIRLSTEEQSKGDGYRRQDESSRKFAANHGLKLVSLGDVGVSAFRGMNVASGALGRFIEAAERGEIPKGSYLLVESFDRLSRQATQTALSLFLRISGAGIHIVTLADNEFFEAYKADHVQLITSILVMTRAHEESLTKSRRLSAVWSAKRQNATERKMTSIAPAWLSLSSDRLSFEVIEESAKIVRRIFEECANGLGSYAITRRLNDDGVPTFGRSQRWVQSYVTKILQNRSVLGEYQPHQKQGGKRIPIGEPWEGYFPVIIDADLYLRAQHGRHVRAIAGRGRKGAGLANLFTGLAKCGYCGAPMRFLNKGSGPKYGKVHLRCRSSLEGAFCHSESWPYEEFEASFMHFVTEIDLASVFSGTGRKALVVDLEERIASQRERLRQSEERRQKTYLLIDEAGMDVGFLAQKLGECGQEIEKCQSDLAALETERAELASMTVVDRNDIADLIQRLRSLEPDERYLLRSRLAARLKELILTLSLRVKGDEPEMVAAHNRIRDGDRIEDFARYDTLVRSSVLNDPELTSPTFSVEFKNGEKREVVVSRDDPARMVSVSDFRKLGLRRYEWDDRSFEM